MTTLSTLSAKEIKANGSIEINHKGDVIVIAWGGEFYHAFHKYGVSAQSRLADIKKIVTYKDYEAFDSVDELENYTWALSNDQIARIHEQAEDMVEPVEFDADSAGDFEPVELTDEHTGGDPFEADRAIVSTTNNLMALVKCEKTAEFIWWLINDQIDTGLGDSFKLERAGLVWADETGLKSKDFKQVIEQYILFKSREIVQPMINTIANLRQIQAQVNGTLSVNRDDVYEVAIRALKSKLLDCYGVKYNRNMATI